MDAFKTSNPLWAPPPPSTTTSSSSSVPSGPSRIPDLLYTPLIKPEIMPGYPALVPPFPFCEGLSMLPSLYASVQRNATGGGSGLINPSTESNLAIGPSWSENRADMSNDCRTDANSGSVWPGASPRLSRIEAPLGADHHQIGLNSEPRLNVIGMINQTNHPKSPDISGKSVRELNKSLTHAANTGSPSKPAHGNTTTATTTTTTTTPTTPTSSSAPTTVSTPTNSTGIANVTSASGHGNTYPENQAGSTNGLVHNTLRKTRSDMKVIHRYLVQVKHDTRDIHQIPYYELDQYIQDFVLTAKKKDGHEYEPESLKAFVHSLERHLKHHDYPHSVLKGSAFTGTRAVLNQRLNELRALSRSGASTHLTYASVFGSGKRAMDDSGLDTGSGHGATAGMSKRSQAGKMLTTGALIQAGLLGKDNPQAVLNSLWLINRTQFNIGGTQRHRNLVWGQFQLITDDHGVKSIKFTPLFESAEVRYCRGHGGGKNTATDFSGRSVSGMQTLTGSNLSKRQPLPFNCVELFELYANLRPVEARGVSEPFYLCPESAWEQSGSWFKTSAAGSQLLSRIPRLLGLKPSREPPVQLDASSIETRDMSGANLTRDPALTNGDRNTSFGHTPVPVPKHFFDQSFPAAPIGSGLPSIHPSLGPNLFNLFPFMFNCPTDTNGSTVAQNPYMLPSSAYANLLANNPLLSYSARFDQDAEKNISLLPVSRASEADDLSRTGELDLCRPKLSPRHSVLRSPLSHPVPSSDGTPSPTDAENLSLSDMSPRLQCAVRGADSTSLSKNTSSSVDNSESVSRKHSGSSSERIKLDDGIYVKDGSTDLSGDMANRASMAFSQNPIEFAKPDALKAFRIKLLLLWVWWLHAAGQIIQ
ncbi:unnamed protein product [Echinostoma caproni]|uniref:DUF3504 domain-containing protein n=1 Tax=Echinostoma caproni TaxID=27848 RepID=A0A183ABF2_9TREM|nr:unnamed protein product [Echinostoma caproni]